MVKTKKITDHILQDTFNFSGFDEPFESIYKFTVFIGTTRPDTIIGTKGDDLIYGHHGNDILKGNGGFDFIYGGNGDDTIHAGNQGGMFFGDRGNDTIYGGYGTDIIDGGIGHDIIDGGSGDDFIFGGTGNDTIYGGVGHDYIEGGAGRDIIDAGKGDDFIEISDIDYSIDGGSGYDTASFFSFGQSMNLIQQGNMIVNLTKEYFSYDGKTGTITNVENVFGSWFNDTIYGDHKANILFGDVGADKINGQGGADLIIGGRGADILSGGIDRLTDTFAYDSIEDSTSTETDNIINFEKNIDKIDLSLLALSIDQLVITNNSDGSINISANDTDLKIHVSFDTNTYDGFGFALSDILI